MVVRRFALRLIASKDVQKPVWLCLQVDGDLGAVFSAHVLRSPWAAAVKPQTKNGANRKWTAFEISWRIHRLVSGQL